MDSKITLVDSDQQTIRLVFSKNSTLNANILVDGQIRYIISTTDRQAQKTSIVDCLAKSELVSIRRNTFLSDKIAFANRYGGAKQSLSDVIKNHKMDDGHTAHIIKTDLGDFYWRTHKIHRLAFFSMSDAIEPVAYRDNINHPINTFALVVRREFEGLLDYIIPTFLLLEGRMRTGEWRSNIAEGMSTRNRVLLGTLVGEVPLPR